MQLINMLLSEYGISPDRIPAERPDIDEIDLRGKIEILERDVNKGIELKIIGAVGYFMREEYYDAARSTERAVRAAARIEHEPYRRVLLTEFGVLSYTKAQESGDVPGSQQGCGIHENLAWALSRHATALADFIEHRVKQRASGNNINLCDAAARLGDSARKAIVLFQSVGINPFAYYPTRGIYAKLALYIGETPPQS